MSYFGVHNVEHFDVVNEFFSYNSSVLSGEKRNMYVFFGGFSLLKNIITCNNTVEIFVSPEKELRIMQIFRI